MSIRIDMGNVMYEVRQDEEERDTVMIDQWKRKPGEPSDAFVERSLDSEQADNWMIVKRQAARKLGEALLET